MTFGRIIYLVTPENRRAVKHTWVPIRFTTIIFVSCDFASFFVQCIGIFVMIGNVTNKTLNEQQRSTGATMTYNILRVGFILQIVAFFAFLVVAFRFMFASKSWRYDWPNGGSGNWRKIAWAVVIASALVTVRMFGHNINWFTDLPRYDLYSVVLCSPSMAETTMPKATNGCSTCLIWYQFSVSSTSEFSNSSRRRTC